uniref:Coiled-coil domain containing 3 n=1 Tax=Bos indicus x Bos taurus TaxID=30522 RepID=A0A4W2DQA5_BOBOX
MLRPLRLPALCLAGRLEATRGGQLPSEWRLLSEGCQAELAEIIVHAKMLALHEEVHGLYNYLPWRYEASDLGLFYSAEIEMLCDQAWGTMLEVPGGSRLNLTGLGYFSCHSHTVVQDYSYSSSGEMDENYNLLPHGVNLQDDVSSLFQFSNCSQGQQVATFSSDWEVQEDTRLWHVGSSVFLAACRIFSCNMQTLKKASFSLRQMPELWGYFEDYRFLCAVALSQLSQGSREAVAHRSQSPTKMFIGPYDRPQETVLMWVNEPMCRY